MNTTKIHRTTIRGLSKKELHSLKTLAKSNSHSLNAELLRSVDYYLVNKLPNYKGKLFRQLDKPLGNRIDIDDLTNPINQQL